MKLWVVAAGAVTVVMGYLALVPVGDGSYSCSGTPIGLLADPMTERSNELFFDEGTQCNADARHRGRKMIGLFLLGGATVFALFVIERRREAATPGA